MKRWSDSGLLPCVKTAGGHRRFDRRDVERLVRSEAAAGWTEWVDALVTGVVHDVQGRLFGERAARGSWHAVALSMGGLLEDIGRRWSEGRLSVVDEHLASATLQRALASIIDAMPVRLTAPRCLLAAAETDAHTLGLSLVELCLSEAGWRAEWAGSPTRTIDIVERVDRGGLAMVALSAAASATDAAALGAQSVSVGSACRRAKVRLALGGEGAWPDSPEYGTRFRSLAPFYEVAREAATDAPDD